MEEEKLKYFKRDQYRLIFLLAVASGFLIYIDLMSPNDPSSFRSKPSNLLVIVPTIFFNMLFFGMIVIAINAERIVRHLKWNGKSNAVYVLGAITFISYLYVIKLSIEMYRIFGDDYVFVHMQIWFILGIIVPLVWIHIDNKKYNIKWWQEFIHHPFRKRREKISL